MPKLIARPETVREAIRQTEHEIIALSTRVSMGYYGGDSDIHDDLVGAKRRLSTLKSLLFMVER